MRARLRIVSVILLLAGTTVLPAAAAEIDSVTRRGEPLTDSAPALERRLNEALEAGVDRANGSPTPCDEAALYRGLRRALASPFIGHVIASSLDDDDALDRRRVRRVDSVYRDLGLLENISVRWKDLSSVIRVGDTLIGVDKIGHFFVEGWAYFETAYLDGEGVEAAMDWGEDTESSYFGHYTTGVHSWADLAANFEGMRFWLRVRGGARDPLGGGFGRNRPYVRCTRRYWLVGPRQWTLARRLDLSDYVTSAWDEAVNCCSYRNEEIEAKVRARIAALSEAAGVDYTCPLDPAACAEVRERYGEWAPRLLHPDCLAAPAPDRPWWRPW
jgi:hypothetical protein